MKMLKNLFSKRNVVSKQDILVESLEGMGDILVFETKRQKNKLVLEGLKKINEIVKDIFEIQKNDHKKFEKLIASQDFVELRKRNENEANAQLYFSPEKHLVGFFTPIDQIVRVYEAAINSQNSEIGNFAVYHLNWILTTLSSQQNNDLFIEQLLRKLAEIMRTSIKHNDNSFYPASRWYFNIVFSLDKKNDFQLSYLGLFDRYFFLTFQYVISENQTAIFQSLISSLVDGAHIPDYHQGKIWDYGHIILHKNFEKYNQLDSESKLERQITELANSENDLNTKEKLDGWLEKFSFLKSIVEPNLDEEDKKVAQKIEEQIRHCTASQFKYQNLLEIVFDIGAYCFFKKKYDYIKYLWQYKQPQDSDGSWIGHDIVPETLDKVIKIYFSKDHFDRKSGFWDGHHGSSNYYKKYFLLLLVRILSNIRPDSDSKYSQIENYKLPDLHIYRLSNLEYSINEFIELVADLKQTENMFVELGFDKKNLEEIFDLKLIPFLNKLKEEAARQISAKHKEEKISQKKVAEFKKEVLKEFQKSGHLRDIFVKYFKTYKNKTEEGISDKENRSGIDIVDDKAAFFDEWHVSYSGWGGSYGRNLISGEDSYLLDEMAKDCKEIAKEEFEATLTKFFNPDDIVIFATNLVFWKFFQNSINFKPEWHRDSNKLEIKGFGGWYDFKGKSIPIFETYQKTINNQMLILNKSKIGNLVQFSPLVKNEKEDLVEDIFYMDVQAFSENEELMKELINSPPEWLRKIGDQQKQQEHLKERVSIKIFERFEYIKPSDFEGYKLSLKEVE